MHETMKEVEKFCDLKEDLLKHLEHIVSMMGTEPECVDVKEAGEITDMIKDLSEASEKCMKKKYYEMLICEMMGTDEDMEQVGRMGYDHWRYASSGHYAPKGRGEYSSHVTGRSGYIPDPDREWEKHPGRHIHAPYEYDANLGPMGYVGERTAHPTGDMMRGGSKYGDAYNRYKDTKKYYTETHDENKKHEMNDHIKESARDTLTAMREMWEDASPEVRMNMKNGLEGLLSEMKKG